MTSPRGTVLFSVVGRLHYGFDLFAVALAGDTAERRFSDGRSINFNGHFSGDASSPTLAFVSERASSPGLYLLRPGAAAPDRLTAVPNTLFLDRPSLNHGKLFFVSAHEPASAPFQSSSAVYSLDLRPTAVEAAAGARRLTPPGVVDYSPAVSPSGRLVAVASYGGRPWDTRDFHDLHTDVVVFPVADPAARSVVAEGGGWPAWAGDSAVFFHRKADDGWWSIFRSDLPENLETRGTISSPRRITPPGLHAFTPAASGDGRRLAVATRRPGTKFRHIEIFDVDSASFTPVTEKVNPDVHHYNPFFSPAATMVGYHRFRGESDSDLDSAELTIPHLEQVVSPVEGMSMVRVNGFFPSISPDRKLIAINQDLDEARGLRVLRLDGSKRWTIVKDRMAFYTSWSPAEKGVVYTSVGPIFESARATVQIARVSFDPSDLTDDRDEVPAKVTILTKEETGNNAFPSCSPDGKSLVFRSGRSGHKNLYIIDAVNGEFEGGNARQLTDGAWIDTMPSWSPDGQFIAFSSNRHNPGNSEAFSIYLIRPDGTGLKRIYLAGPEGSLDADKERINHVCFSPDSQWLLFTSNLAGVTAEPVSLPNQFQPYGELFVSRLDGSELRRLTWNAYEDGTPAWYAEEDGLPARLGRLKLQGSDSRHGDKLRGRFEEPRWITFD